MNLEGAERIYTKGAGPMCPRDGYVLFRNSELLCGRLGKQTLGGGNKASLFQARALGLGRLISEGVAFGCACTLAVVCNTASSALHDQQSLLFRHYV